jgi:hypothetical protein
MTTVRSFFPPSVFLCPSFAFVANSWDRKYPLHLSAILWAPNLFTCMHGVLLFNNQIALLADIFVGRHIILY